MSKRSKLGILAGTGCLLAAMWVWSLCTVDYRTEVHWVELGGDLKLNDVQIFTLRELSPSQVELRGGFDGQWPANPVYDWSITFTKTDLANKRVRAHLTGSYDEGSPQSSQWISEGESIKTAAGRVYTVDKVTDGAVDFQMHDDFVIRLGEGMFTGNQTQLDVAAIDTATKRAKFLYHVPTRVGAIAGFLAM